MQRVCKPRAVQNTMVMPCNPYYTNYRIGFIKSGDFIERRLQDMEAVEKWCMKNDNYSDAEVIRRRIDIYKKRFGKELQLENQGCNLDSEHKNTD